MKDDGGPEEDRGRRDGGEWVTPGSTEEKQHPECGDVLKKGRHMNRSKMVSTFLSWFPT